MDKVFDIIKNVTVTGSIGAFISSIVELVQEKFLFKNIPLGSCSFTENIIVFESSLVTSAIGYYISDLLFNSISSYIDLDINYKYILLVFSLFFNISIIQRLNIIKMEIKKLLK